MDICKARSRRISCCRTSAGSARAIPMLELEIAHRRPHRRPRAREHRLRAARRRIAARLEHGRPLLVAELEQVTCASSAVLPDANGYARDAAGHCAPTAPSTTPAPRAARRCPSTSSSDGRAAPACSCRGFGDGRPCRRLRHLLRGRPSGMIQLLRWPRSKTCWPPARRAKCWRILPPADAGVRCYPATANSPRGCACSSTGSADRMRAGR